MRQNGGFDYSVKLISLSKDWFEMSFMIARINGYHQSMGWFQNANNRLHYVKLRITQFDFMIFHSALKTISWKWLYCDAMLQTDYIGVLSYHTGYILQPAEYSGYQPCRHCWHKDIVIDFNPVLPRCVMYEIHGMRASGHHKTWWQRPFFSPMTASQAKIKTYYSAPIRQK